MFGAGRSKRLLRAGIALCACLLVALHAGATNLVTGNGFGFAVVDPQTATVTKLYAHPYSFVRADSRSPLSEGVETANFLKSLGWNTPATVEYEQDSQVIHAHGASGDGFVYMPWNLHRTALIVDSSLPPLSVEWSHPLHSQKLIHISGVAAQVLRFDGVDESLLLIPLNGNAAEPHFPASSNAWVLIPVERDGEIEPAVHEFTEWRGNLAPHQLVQRELVQLERWRVKPAVHFARKAERHLWRESEVMLRMAQSREPNTATRHGNGLIVASLPDGVWFTPWVRDMAYAAVALARMGHREEARAALMAYFNAQPTGKMRAETAGADYQISVVRYFGDGSEEPFFTEEGSTNIEFDDWGEALWALGEYMREYHDTALLKAATYRGSLYQSARDFVVKPLFANLEPYQDGEIVAADTSIWEEHQKDKKHFAFSTAAAIFGLRGFAEIAHTAGDEPTRAEAMRHLALLEKGFTAAFIRSDKLHGTLEESMKNDIDGALLAIINLGVVTDPALMQDTANRMELLKVASGGYRRVRSTYTDPAIFEYWYERQEFVFVDFSLAEVYRRLGRKQEADAMLKRVVDKAAADHNIIPEMYVAEPCKLFPGAIGDPTSARPMVGYGAGAYILHLLNREHLR